MNEPFIDELPEERKKRRIANTALALALLPLLAVFGFPIAVEVGGRDELEIAFWIWTFSCGAAVIGIIQGIRAYRRGVTRGLIAAIIGFLLPPITLFLSLFFIPFTRGRAFRRRGHARLPRTETNEHWRGIVRPVLIDAEATAELADAWRVMAATEAASIAAFSSLSHQLLAIGAPSELLEMAHRDALDEIEHARLCYEVARGIDGQSLGAASFPEALLPGPKSITALSLAKDCLKESCILESASAKTARGLSETARQPFRSVLSTIAEDEARHAAHGWAILEWLVQERGVRTDALTGVIVRLRRERVSSLVDHERFERYGVASSTRWRAAVSASIDDADARLRQLARAA